MKKLTALTLSAIFLVTLISACTRYVPFVRDNPGQTTTFPFTPPYWTPPRATEPPLVTEPPSQPPLPEWPPLAPLEPLEHITPPPRPVPPPQTFPEYRYQIMLEFLSRFPNLHNHSLFCCDDCGLPNTINHECYYERVARYNILNIGDDMPAILTIEFGWHWGPTRLYRFVEGEYRLVEFRFDDGEFRTYWFPMRLGFYVNESESLIAFLHTDTYSWLPPRAYYVNFNSATRISFERIPLSYDFHYYMCCCDTHVRDDEFRAELGISPLYFPIYVGRTIRRLTHEMREIEFECWGLHFSGVTDETLARMIANGEIPLDIGELHIHGYITNTDALFWFEDLTRLTIFSEYLTCLRGLVNMRNLTELDIREANAPDLRPLSYLENLVRLLLMNSNISDLRPLAYSTNLRQLWLSHNQIEDLRPLANLTNLETLILNHNQIIDLRSVSNLTNLRSMELINNQIENIAPLFSLYHLSHLHLRSNPVPHAQVQELRSVLSYSVQIFGP